MDLGLTDNIDCTLDCTKTATLDQGFDSVPRYYKTLRFLSLSVVGATDSKESKLALHAFRLATCKRIETSTVLLYSARHGSDTETDSV